MMSQICLLLTGSIPVVGSSRNITEGEFIPAIVIESLLFIPPLKVPTRSSITYSRFTLFNISLYFSSLSSYFPSSYYYYYYFRLSYNIKCSFAVNSFHRMSN
jgi:hypothetical protein